MKKGKRQSKNIEDLRAVNPLADMGMTPEMSRDLDMFIKMIEVAKGRVTNPAPLQYDQIPSQIFQAPWTAEGRMFQGPNNALSPDFSAMNVRTFKESAPPQKLQKGKTKK